MGSIKDENIKHYKLKEENAYLFNKPHVLRGEVAIGLIKEVIPSGSKDIKLLSIACSTGVIEEKIIKKLGINVYGIDGAKESLLEAEKRGVITKHGDISKKLPYDDDYFDFVFGGEIIEHLINTRDFLNEVKRVLKPKGYLVLTTPNLARFDDRIKLLIGKTPRQTSPMHPYLFLHIRPFTFDSLKEALEICGFGNVLLKTQVITSELKFFKFETYSKFLTGLFPTFGSTLIVRAQKI